MRLQDIITKAKQVGDPYIIQDVTELEGQALCNAPELRFRETAQSLPAGLWRWTVSGDAFFLDRNTATAGDFSTLDRLVQLGNDVYIGDFEAGIAEKACYGMNSFDISDTDLEEFDVGSMPSGWTWATYSGYVTPTTDFSRRSLLSVTFTSDARAFLYRTDGTFYNPVWARVGLNCNNIGYFCGVRFDDGTDNNYGEVGVRYKSSGMYDLITRTRVGGGTAYETIRYQIPAVVMPMVLLDVQGSYWTNWSLQAQCRAATGASNCYISNILTSQTWTVARRGLVFEGINSSWQKCLVDWVRVQ